MSTVRFVGLQQMVNECKDGVQVEWLALRCQTGDPEAFADLIAVMERPLLYYAISLTGNQDAALDTLLDVWLRVLHDQGRNAAAQQLLQVLHLLLL